MNKFLFFQIGTVIPVTEDTAEKSVLTRSMLTGGSLLDVVTITVACIDEGKDIE